jgi:hypothetical protein
MKKNTVILVLLLLISTQAHAEHKLLVTDILDKGQSEISANYSYNHAKNNYSDKLAIYPSGTRKLDFTSSTLSTAIGLGSGIQISASIPYNISQKATYTLETSPPVSSVSKREGLGDLEIGVRGLIVEEKTSPVTLVVGLDVKLDMREPSHGGTGTTNIAPYIALSRRVASETRLFAAYAAVLRNHSATDSHTLLAGTEQIVSRRVTVVAEGGLTFWNNGERTDNTKEFGGALAAYLQLYGNTYLIPSLRASMLDGFDWKDSRVHYGNTRELGGTIKLYHLF